MRSRERGVMGICMPVHIYSYSVMDMHGPKDRANANGMGFLMVEYQRMAHSCVWP